MLNLILYQNTKTNNDDRDIIFIYEHEHIIYEK
jgi:hypothetical protein